MNNISAGKCGAVVRPTERADLDRVMAIYDYARRRMAASGNPTQWIDGYPSRDLILEDIATGHSYAIESGAEITGVFTFVIGLDPTYRVIEGKWLNHNPYGTIHRIASAPGAKGIADTCLDFCKSQISDIRIDTHADNIPMLGWLQSRGFIYCGIIHCHNGSPRKAFQKRFSSANG